MSVITNKIRFLREAGKQPRSHQGTILIKVTSNTIPSFKVSLQCLNVCDSKFQRTTHHHVGWPQLLTPVKPVVHSIVIYFHYLFTSDDLGVNCFLSILKIPAQSMPPSCRQKRTSYSRLVIIIVPCTPVHGTIIMLLNLMFISTKENALVYQ